MRLIIITAALAILMLPTLAGGGHQLHHPQNINLEHGVTLI
jgi:hypothetical protein